MTNLKRGGGDGSTVPPRLAVVALSFSIMNSGWIKMYRRIQDSCEWKHLSAKGKLVMVLILLNCNYKDSEVIIGGKKVKLVPGQWLTSLSKIQELGGRDLSVKNIRTALDVLQTGEFLANEVAEGNKRIITVKNWDIYQSEDMELADETADNRQRGGKEVAISKEVRSKEGKELKENTLSEISDSEPDNCEIIFGHWNTCPNLITHRKLGPDMKRKVLISLKKHIGNGLTMLDMLNSITNYNTVLGDQGTYYWTHKWTLQDFMSRGVEKFVDAAKPLENFRSKKNKSDDFTDREPDLYKDFGDDD